MDARRATADVLRARPATRAVHVIALGKAAIGMTEGVLEVCDVEAGLVVAPRGGPERGLPRSLEVLRGAHPVPDADVAQRGEAMLAFASAIPTNAEVVVLVSGGGSALVDAPVAGVTAADLADLTRRLLAGGASIDELNAIRVTLSRSKGGGLARALVACRTRVIVISDVVFGDPSQVASGPMSPWRGPAPSEVASRRHVAQALTPHERRLVLAWRDRADTGVPLEVAADNARAVRAASDALRSEGLRVEPGPVLRGEARTCGEAWARAARETDADALVSGGETVVTVRGRGRGGRCQEMALAAHAARIGGALLCAGTDGIDGPTDAAGAWIDDAVRTRLDDAASRRALDDNDAYTALARAGALLVTGPTGTNVADLAIWARAGRASR